VDVGSGEGKFAASLSTEYAVINIESPFAKVKNPSVIKTDFLSWRYSKALDIVTFWESLEHVPNPRAYVEKAYRLLRKNGHIMVECPRYDSLEARFFGSSWFHLDMPRHTVHFTNEGLQLLLRRSGFGNVTIRSVGAFEYSIWGVAASVLASFGISDIYLRRKEMLPVLLLLLPIFFLGFVIEYVMFLCGNTPISVVTAEKITT
jgi:SAM-dependent methyltransferase